MKIKRFHAKTMREAIRMVREEQGADAVILSNRRIPGGVEVVSAVDYDAALIQQTLRRPQQTEAPSGTAPADTAEIPVEVSTSSRLQPASSAKADKPVEQHVAAVQQAPVAAPTPTVASASAQIEHEIISMRRMLEEQLAGLMWGDMQRRRPRQATALRALAELGLDPDLARSIAEEIPDSSDAERARFLPLGLLGRRIPVDATDPVQQGGVIALVGPTGVGKTTTIAKLAARFAVNHGIRDIALVTTDHYRIGAQEQLYTYGRLIGVPVYAVGANEDLVTTLARLDDRKLVLVDTAGLSHRDKTLAMQIAKLRAAGPKLKSYLVVASNTQPASMVDAAKRFNALPLSGCILTKIDEADRIGAALSVMIRRSLPIAYFTDGQRVPEDIHPARADRLVLRATQLARQTPSSLDDRAIATGFTTVAHANA
jgi:flagellar biosynthesis protein FlhF